MTPKPYSEMTDEELVRRFQVVIEHPELMDISHHKAELLSRLTRLRSENERIQREFQLVIENADYEGRGYISVETIKMILMTKSSIAPEEKGKEESK